MSSRLFTEVRERRGLAYYVFGLNHSYTDAGSLYTQAGVDINRIDEAVTTIAAELRKIAAEPVPADELEKARSFSKGRFVLQLESPQGLIVYGLRKEVLEGRAPDPEEILAGIDAVTAEDVQRVAPRRDRGRTPTARADRSVRRRRALRRAARLTLRAGRALARSAVFVSGGGSDSPICWQVGGPVSTSARNRPSECFQPAGRRSEKLLYRSSRTEPDLLS